jgi:membrane dipeptidase
MFIADAHLDLAYNALRGRRILLHARNQTPDEEGTPTVGLPDLREGGIGLICATIFCDPAKWKKDGTGYKTPEEAHAQAIRQLRWYEELHQRGEIRIVQTADDFATDARRRIAAIILLEGADAIRTPQDLDAFHAAGLRIVGLAWKSTRYAGGTGEPGPLTADGVELVRHLDRLHLIHDLSHLAEESFWQLLRLTTGPVMASHSNCRHYVPTDRQLSDEMIRAVIARGGVIGINFFDKFLLSPDVYGKRKATFADVVRHIRHICELAGNANHVAIGTDFDGGFGLEQVPAELKSGADLGLLGPELEKAGYFEKDIRLILGENWRRFFGEHLDA